MRTSRVYIASKLNVGDTVLLDAETAHYLANVLRLKKGDKVILFNGEAGDVQGTIESITKKELRVRLDTLVAEPRASSIHIHLGLVMSKGDRMDYGIQKSVELGVSEISPLFSDFCEVRFKEPTRRDNKLRHWRRVATAACEQCGAHSPPLIHEPTQLESFIETNSNACRLLFDARADMSLSAIAEAEDFQLLVGPEGGFSEKELALAKSQGYKSVHLGSRILRTETAPVAALAILQSKFGEW